LHRFAGRLDTIARLWLGAGVDEHVGQSYRFLMETYRTGDRVFLFGSSRGARMANALASALDCFWLVEKASPVVIPYVLQSVGRTTIPEARQFRAALSRECDPYFIGMWDCVQMYRRTEERLPELRLPARTPFGFHALAIDERRRLFRPVLWGPRSSTEQTVEQIWFSGVHADVCGGYPESGLADLTLRWMIDKAIARGMLVDAEGYAQLTPDPLAPIHESSGVLARLLAGSSPRHIPPRSLIHPSVRHRQRTIGYAPQNLPDQVEVAVPEESEPAV
jgi:uncharacterized protein (DUF2235 family)